MHRLVPLALVLALPGAALAQQNRFEPNQTRRTAQKLEPGDFKGILCNGEDWFAVEVPRGQRLEVGARFDVGKGDLELELHDNRGKRLGWSAGTEAEEALSFTPGGAATVFVRVHDATNVYDLHIGLAPVKADGGGPLEVQGWGADWYSYTVEGGQELRADLTFKHTEGDLDLKLLDDEKTELAASDGQEDSESLRWTAPGAQARTVLLCVKAAHGGRSRYGLRTSVGAATPEDLPRVLRRDRPVGKGVDVVELTNGDVLKGTILNESFKIATSYAELELAAARIAGIDLERNRTEIESIHTVDSNKLSGFLRTQTLRFRMDGVDQPVEIRRERVSRAIFGQRGNERGGLQRHQYVVLKNGDHFSARLSKSEFVLDTGFARLPVALGSTKAMQFDGNGGTNVIRMNDSSTRGRLNVEELELELDIVAGAEGAAQRFKLHPDRVDVLYCQEGFVPESTVATGTATSFDFEEAIDPWVAAGNWNTNWIHFPREGVRGEDGGEGCVRACGPNGQNYGDNANANLTSPPIPIGGIATPVLRLQVKTRLERGPDLFVIRVSYDNGQTFAEAHRLTGDNEWAQVVLPLTAGAGDVVVQFGLTSDGSIVNGGVWVDAVEVGDAGDGGALPQVGPGQGPDGGDGEER